MIPSQLQHELKKRGPFASREQEAVLNLLRTSDLFQNRLGRLFRKHGLTGSQYNVLRILRGEGKPLPSLEIADRLIQVVPAITGLVDRLEKQELVQRVRCEKDRRVVYVTITDKAQAILAAIDLPLAELQQQLVGRLTPQELEQLIVLLEKTRHGVTELTA